MLSRPIRLAVVEEHAIFRKMLENFLAEQHNMSVVVTAADAYELLEKLKMVSVDVVLMDIFLPDMNGNEVVPIIRSAYPDIKILMLSHCTRMELISDVLEKGIYGFVSKSDAPEELLLAIESAAENRIYRNPLVTEALYCSKENTFNAFSETDNPSLNDREKKMLQLIWEEKSNKEIANELFLGVRSVEKIRQDLKEKIGVKSVVGMLKYALDKRLIGASLQSTDIDK